MGRGSREEAWSLVLELMVFTCHHEELAQKGKSFITDSRDFHLKWCLV